MLNWWGILGIERSADKRTIKRAYAKKLKTIRQDEDPEAFMRLREAYETALAKAKTKHRRFLRLNPETIRLYPEGHSQDIAEPAAPEIFVPRETLFQEALVVLHQTHPTNAATLKHRKQQWSAIIDDPRIEAIDDFTWFQEQLIVHLLDHTKFHTNRHIRDSLQQLKKYVTPILRPPLSNFVFTQMGWDAQNVVQKERAELHWLAFQFGVLVEDTPETYWYYDKVELDKTVRWIKIESKGMAPLPLLGSTIVILIMLFLLAKIINTYVF